MPIPSLLKCRWNWRTAFLVGFALVLLWYGTAAPRGRLMAHVDYAQGRYRVKGFFPEQTSSPAYCRLLEEKYSVIFDFLELRPYQPDTEAYAYGYNDVSVRLLNEKYGRDIFAECRAQAERTAHVGAVFARFGKTNANNLCKVADDPQAERADRVAAVFALFANHLKPPCGSAAAGQALGEAKWLTDAKCHPLEAFNCWLPLEFVGDATIYFLYLFPPNDGQSDSVICLQLTGGPWQTPDDLRDFLRGGKGLKGKREMVEFALCNPLGTNRMPRIEHFGPRGRRVLREGD